MANRYLIVIPPHKEPYIKSFNNKEKAISIIASKTGREPLAKTATDALERETVLFSVGGKKRKHFPVNAVASALAPIGEKEMIYGNAVISGVPGDEHCGFTLEEADAMLKEVNRI